MALIPIANYSMDWVKVPSDYQKCYKCEQMITGEMNIPITFIGKIEDLNLNEIEIKLCNSCFSESVFNHGK